MPRPKNEEGFRLIKRNFEGRKLFYVRFIDEEGTVIATRSTGTDDEKLSRKP
jgi:putative heme iron utilization protein